MEPASFNHTELKYLFKLHEYSSSGGDEPTEEELKMLANIPQYIYDSLVTKGVLFISEQYEYLTLWPGTRFVRFINEIGQTIQQRLNDHGTS